jgi:S1-C subfamily serine protease
MRRILLSLLVLAAPAAAGVVPLHADGEFVGSGVVVDGGDILTCAHVLDEGVECEVLAYDEDLDLALIRVDELTGEPTPWSVRTLVSGDAVQVHAYFEEEPVVTRGIASNAKMGWTDAMILAGMSGGAVLDKDGNLVGVVVGVFGFDEIDYIGEFITLPTIEEFMEGRER